MARAIGSVVGSKDYLTDFFVSAAVINSQILIREPTASQLGEVHDPTTTAAAHCVGCATDAATSNTSPTVNPGNLLVVAAGGLENIVRVESNPFAIYRLKIAGGATTGLALATTLPSNVIVITTADVAAPYATLTAAAASVGNVGSIDMSGGIVKGRTGNNAGQIRKLISHVNTTSCTVGIGFLNPTAVGDTFIRVPFSRACITVQLTTDFVEANGIIAYGTGAGFRVVNVEIDEQRDVAFVDMISGDHFLNPIA